MYVTVYINVKSPLLCFPKAGGKPRNTASCKTVDVFSCPAGGKMSDLSIVVIITKMEGQKGGFFQIYADLTG